MNNILGVSFADLRWGLFESALFELPVPDIILAADCLYDPHCRLFALEMQFIFIVKEYWKSLL